MPLTAISIEGYRSVRRLYLPIGNLSVFVGANGVGKTNLYNGLALLRAAAEGTITRAVAVEGGVESVLWAGARRKGDPVRLALRAHFDDDMTYEIEIGLPAPAQAALDLEPLVKEEKLVVRHARRDVVMMERKNSAVMLRNAEGARETHPVAMLPSETVLESLRDAARYPELEVVRRELADWRLYHDFRTDAGSPIRQPSLRVTTPTLAADGHNLAAVFATLFSIRRDVTDLSRAIDDAFPGARLTVLDEGNRTLFGLLFPEMPQRLFRASELSDGTLKYLCLLAALMSYRLPSLIALNEPEGSLHPSLLNPLARLITRATENARVWIVTHSDALAEALRAEAGTIPRRVVKKDGETILEGQKASGEFRDDEDD